MNNHSYVLIQYTTVHHVTTIYSGLVSHTITTYITDLIRHIAPNLSPTTPYNPTTLYTILSHTIHYAIIYHTPYNYISIMYISYCYHLSITYHIIKYIIIYHTMQSNISLLCIVLLYFISIRI